MGSTRYEYILGLNDKMSGVLRKVGVKGGNTYDKLQRKQERLDRSADKLGRTFRRMTAGFGVAMLGRQILKAGADIESTRVAFGTFMGDVDAGNRMIAQLNEFSNITPFENDAVIAAGRSLLAAQIPAEKIQSTLKAIGDVAAGANVPLTDMANIYAKAMNKGRVQGEELNQLAERGVPILATFSKMYGKTTAEVMKMGEKGLLTSGELAKAFQIMTSEGGMFNNMMQKQALTVGGKWSTLMGKMQLKFQQVGEATNGLAKIVLDKLIAVVDNLDETWRKITDSFTWYINALQTGHPWIIGITAAVAGLAATFVVMKTVTFAWAVAFKVLNAVMSLNPTFLLIAGIVALIAAITWVIYKTKGWGETWGNLMEYMKLSFFQVGSWMRLKMLQIADFFLTGFEIIGIGWHKLEKLWNKDASTAGLAHIEAKRNARAEEIATEKGLGEQFKAQRKGMNVFALEWDKTNTFSGVKDKIAGALGLDAMGTGGLGAGALSTAGDGSDSSIVSTTSTGIAGGGAKATNVNITLGNLVENLNISAADMKEGAEEMENMVREALLRVLNSANGVAMG